MPMGDGNEISGDFSVSTDLVNDVKRFDERTTELIALFEANEEKLGVLTSAESLKESDLKYDADTKDSEIQRKIEEIASVKVSKIKYSFSKIKIFSLVIRNFFICQVYFT